MAGQVSVRGRGRWVLRVAACNTLWGSCNMDDERLWGIPLQTSSTWSVRGRRHEHADLMLRQRDQVATGCDGFTRQDIAQSQAGQ